MNRRQFVVSSALGAVACRTQGLLAAEPSPLLDHRLAAMEFRRVRLPWPREVGRNAVKGHHGRGPTITACVLKTDQGATGWGHLQSSRAAAAALEKRVIGQPVGALIQPSSGIVDRSLHPLDIPLHDLAGMILRQPVWKLIGVETPFVTSVYSGMIYFDDVDFGANRIVDGQFRPSSAPGFGLTLKT